MKENRNPETVTNGEAISTSRLADGERWYMDSRFMKWYIREAAKCSWSRRAELMYGCIIVARTCGQNDVETKNAVTYLACEIGKANGKIVPDAEIEYALRHLEDENLHRVSREKLSEITGIAMKESKRNGRTMAEHQDYRREREAIDRRSNPEKYSAFCKAVPEWRQRHPNGTKANCARNLGCSRPTVDRWWDPDQRSTGGAKKPRKKRKTKADDKRRKCPECGQYARRHSCAYDEVDELHEKVYHITMKVCKLCGSVIYERKIRNHGKEDELGFHPIPVSSTTQYKAIQKSRADAAKKRANKSMPWK